MLRLLSWSQATSSPAASAATVPVAGPTPGVPDATRYADNFRRSSAFEPAGGGKVSKPSVIPMPSPNQSSRNGARIDTVVLHHTAGGGTAQDVGRYFQNASAKVSSHYIVGKDGAIVQPVSDDRNAWHAGTSEFKGRSNVNNFSIGIEIVNHGNGSDPYTDAQYKALARLVAYLQSEYGIPWERIIGHKDVALPRGRKIDPSSNFSYDRLRREVQAVMGGQQPAPAPAPAPQPAPAPAPAPPAPSPAGPIPSASYSAHAGPLPGPAASHVGVLPTASHSSPAGPIPSASYSSAAGPLPGGPAFTMTPAPMPAVAAVPNATQAALSSQLAALQQMASGLLSSMTAQRTA